MADIGCGDTVAAGPSLCLGDCMDTDFLADNCYALREEESFMDARIVMRLQINAKILLLMWVRMFRVRRHPPSEFIVSGTFWVDMSWRATLVLQFFTGKCSRSGVASVMVAGRSQLPMPLPFNLSGKSDVPGEELAFRKILNLQVGYLNYLHLGMPASPPNYICQPGELNSAHWKIVERLRRLCKVWNQTVEVNADDMGRFAAKQERQEGVLEDLFKLASSLSRSLKKYGLSSHRVTRCMLSTHRAGNISQARSFSHLIQRLLEPFSFFFVLARLPTIFVS